MVTGRQGQTATRLSDGRVLISGGMADGGGLDTALSSAELYDPQNGTFRPTGSMTVGRVGHTATLLSNGRVLIAGGGGVGDGAPGLASAELYDPESGSFSPTGSLTVARRDHTATLLPDGRVLIAGGDGNLASAELYDPKNGTFGPTGSMTAVRGGATATLLTDGRVLIAGGSIDASAELYDPKNGTFSSTGSMTAVRGGAAATLLTDGRVLIAGGLSSPNNLASVEIYDPNKGAFVATGSMLSARGNETATLLNDGRVLIAGGMDWPQGSAPEYLASAELLQP